MINFDNLLTEPEPVADETLSGENCNLGTVSARQPTAVSPQARILYADDEPTLRSLGELVLAGLGYAVDTVADGVEAWTALHDKEYHLLITDYQMPRLTGLDLIRKVRLANMKMPIILASSMVSSFGKRDLPWLDCGAMLAKPFTARKLISVVQAILQAEVAHQRVN